MLSVEFEFLAMPHVKLFEIRVLDIELEYISTNFWPNVRLTLLRFSGVFSDPGGRKSFLILLSVGYFCYQF